MAWTKYDMAEQVIKFFKPGCSVNLGIGMPTIIAEMIPPDLNLVIHSENGVMGVNGRPTRETISPTLINAGKETVAIAKGASFFDSSLSFGMIRGGHIDFCVLGGMEVDCKGSLANWMIPGKKVTGMGGAMDLVNGARTLIVMQKHYSKSGDLKLKKQCELPLTGFAVVDVVVTDLGVFKICDGKFNCLDRAPNVSKSDLGLGDILG
tara:strand:- start:2381 stop:3001 length:621 start_codon:yes stop_codon:yes gene_type:complete